MTSILPYLILSIAIWITYLYTIHCGFVIDDQDGIATYDGKLQGFQYGMLARWVRFNLCGGNYPSKHKRPDGSFLPLGKVPSRHHTLSVIVFNLAILACYPWLSEVIGSNLALLSLLLYIVHPIAIQAVGWVSGIGYSLCLLWMSMSLNMAILYKHNPSPEVMMAVLPLFCIFQFLMVEALVSSATFCILLVLLGFWQFAIFSLLICVYLGFQTIKETWNLRKKVFVEQDMKKTTILKPRKFIVALKTLVYYSKLVLWPSKLGLYHKWGYHYDKDMEREDWMSLCGFLIVLGLGFAYFYFPITAIRLGILIFGIFIVAFLNWVTVQQFIAERYVFIPTLGVCIVLAYLTQNTILYPFILGAYWVRTLMHLPTYDDEVRFYQSNMWNFPNCEVPYGNYGCVMLRLGYVGTAMDSWKTSAKMNPNYDVPHYNIFANYKSNAMLQLQGGNLTNAIALLKEGEPWLKQCLASDTCHYRTTWQREYEELQKWLANPYSLLSLEKERLIKLRATLLLRKNDPNEKDVPGVESSLEDIRLRLEQIDKIEERENLKCQYVSQVEAQASSAPTSATN